MSKGWILLHRSIQDCWLWRDEPFTKAQAWIDLLLLANHRDKKISIDGKPITIIRGQFHTSINKLADRWMWDRKRVMRFLDVLEDDSMVEQLRTSKGTTLTIVNYEIYQCDGTAIGTTDGTTVGTAIGTTVGTTVGTQTKNIKKENNVNNEKNEKKYKDVFFPEDDILNDSFKSFVEMRKKIKSPMTDKAIDLAVKKLRELGNDNSDVMVKIVEQSVMNSWKGLFPLKEYKNNRTEQEAANEWLKKWEDA